MKILTSLFGGGSAQTMTASINGSGVNLALPYSATLDLLWSYYLSNGVYDELRLAGFFLDDNALKGLRNPAGRVVKFYVDTIWHGRLPDALPLDTARNDLIAPAILDLWKWSNWQNRKQLLVRLTAVLGEVYIKVAQPIDKPGRV